MQSDFELRNVEATSPLMRSLSTSDDTYTQERIETLHGSIVVAHQGSDHRVPGNKKPVLITYHDIGLNHNSNFQAFFNFPEMKFFQESFSILHVNAPGQEENAPILPDNYVYPSMDQLAEQLEAVLKHYEVKSFIGLGVGVGANILARYALQNSSHVDGLFLINCVSTVAGWIEWIYQKVNMYYLNGAPTATLGVNVFSQKTQEYLMWHHFGQVNSERNHDLIECYRKHFTGKTMNAKNLAMFIDSYVKRTDLNIARGPKERNFKSPVLLICGDYSPHVDCTVTTNSRLNPNNSTWMKLSDCGMVLEEQPGKVAEALRLFIQGLGYSLAALERRRSSARKLSISNGSGDFMNGNRKDSATPEMEDIEFKQVHIVENPIAQC